MTTPKRKRGRILLAWVVAVVLVFSAAITLSDGRLAYLPTWGDLLAVSGFRADSVGEEELRITVLDVGNADCLLVQSGEHSALIDAGETPEKQATLTRLRAYGVRRLDYVFATHMGDDHIAAMDDVIRGMEIGEFITPYVAASKQPTTRCYAKLAEALAQKRITMTAATFGATYTIGCAQLTILSERLGIDDSPDPARSLVCRVTFGKHSVLLMGDADAIAERNLLSDVPELKADVIKVGDHGSRSASDAAFIEAVRPSYAVITCGFGYVNTYPHGNTLAALQAVNAQVFRSDLNGDIVISSDGNTLTVTGKR